MTKLKFAFALLFAVNFVQANTQSDENELYPEGSAYMTKLSELPIDDEDLVDEDIISGSGDFHMVDVYDLSETNTETTLATTTTTIIIDEENPINNFKDTVIIEDNPDQDGPSKEPAPNNSTSFFSSTTFMAALIIAGSLGLILALCVILLVVYRLKKKDQGSYPLDDDIKPAGGYAYTQGQEYFA